MLTIEIIYTFGLFKVKERSIILISYTHIMKQIMSKLFFALLTLLTLSVTQVTNAQLIPQPVEKTQRAGYFIINKESSVVFSPKEKDIPQIVNYFINKIEELSGYELKKGSHDTDNSIIFIQANLSDLGNEGYILDITPDKIIIKYNKKNGAFYAVQSLLQFLPMVRTNEKLAIKSQRIKDYPQYVWRGMMLDVSRHFFTVETIKKTLDMLAFYKINTFHWHLCDNEGWRLEIKKYPKLTEIGAWREDMPYARIYQKDYVPVGKPYKYGGYYTQEQVKDIVAYAKERNITVIPEIEMPGHSGAALSAYPQYSCKENKVATPNNLLHQSVENTEKYNLNYCAGNEATFLFLEDILDEVLELFPSEYIHIGGDEVDKTDWKTCPKCQARIKKEKLKNEEELQSYFIKRIEKYLLKHNRKLLGWDEILEGGLAKSATVMSWRGEKGGIEAAKMGHHVIMAPSNPLYLLRHQDSTDIKKFHAPTYSINSLDKVYNYNPASAKLTKDELRYILGAQFSVWTEFMPSVSHFEYMIYPRMAAFAEVAWSPTEKKDFNDFVERLNSYHFPYWNLKGIRFHPKYYHNTVYP